jgi:hypothetical protein
MKDVESYAMLFLPTQLPGWMHHNKLLLIVFWGEI